MMLINLFKSSFHHGKVLDLEAGEESKHKRNVFEISKS